MATRNREMSLHDYLNKIRLESYEQKLDEKSIKSVSDLKELDQSALISEIGMTLVHARRVLRTMGEMFPHLVS